MENRKLPENAGIPTYGANSCKSQIPKLIELMKKAYWLCWAEAEGAEAAWPPGGAARLREPPAAKLELVGLPYGLRELKGCQ